MTLTACLDGDQAATAPPMEGTPWQIRAKQLGLNQRRLARLTGKPENTISRQMRGEFGEVPGYLVAIIMAWEYLGPGAREAWADAVERELERRAK